MTSQKISDNFDEYFPNVTSQSKHRDSVAILFKNIAYAIIGSQTYVFRIVTPLQSNLSLNFLILSVNIVYVQALNNVSLSGKLVSIWWEGFGE